MDEAYHATRQGDIRPVENGKKGGRLNDVVAAVSCTGPMITSDNFRRLWSNVSALILFEIKPGRRCDTAGPRARNLFHRHPSRR